MRLPKSVPESQKYVTWAFPVILGFAAACLIEPASWQGRIGVVVGMAIVFTGWSSFGIIAERDYNDLLMVCDLALLTSYVLLIFYCKTLTMDIGPSDLGLWTASTAIFSFYAIWDFSALIARDTSALASRLHLRRFGIICSVVAISFAVGAIVSNKMSQTPTGSSLATFILRSVLLAMWLMILVWWHYGRVRAALADGRTGE